MRTGTSLFDGIHANRYNWQWAFQSQDQKMYKHKRVLNVGTVYESYLDSIFERFCLTILILKYNTSSITVRGI